MSNNYTFSIASWLLAVTAAATFLSGCDKSPAPQFQLNQVEILRQEKVSLDEGEHFADSYSQEIEAVLVSLFGTPDAPK